MGGGASENAVLLSGGMQQGRRHIQSYTDLRYARRRNVRLMYWHVFCFTIYQSICQWNLFDAYLSILARSKGFVNMNTWVGFAEGIMGATTLILAMPLGILADAVDRIFLLRLTGVIGVLASCISAYAFAFDHIVTLYTNLFLWGVFTGLQGTAAEAVFADSIDRGKRSSKFMWKGVLSTCGLSLGPLLMLLLFYEIGDKWSLHHLHKPLVLGCLFAPLCCVPFFFFRDPNLTPEQELFNSQVLNSLRAPLLPLQPAGTGGGGAQARKNSLSTPAAGAGKATPAPVIASSPMFKRDRVGSHISDYVSEIDYLPEASLAGAHSPRLGGSATPATTCISVTPPLSEAGDKTSPAADGVTASKAATTMHVSSPASTADQDDEKRNLKFSERCIPYIITASDFVTEVGAGMTVRFFPLFFMKDYHVTPVGLCAIFCMYPLLCSLAMPVCQYVGACIGRAHASLMFQVSGCLMLLLLARVDSLPILIVVFMIRGQLQNAAYPVDRSILMDYIPSKHRGKWASITSLTTMTWSGSAVLGGYLADRHDYRFTFLITAMIYACGSLVYSPLIFLVPRKEADPPTSILGGSTGRHRARSSTLSQAGPLLASVAATSNVSTQIGPLAENSAAPVSGARRLIMDTVVESPGALAGAPTAFLATSMTAETTPPAEEAGKNDYSSPTTSTVSCKSSLAREPFLQTVSP